MNTTKIDFGLFDTQFNIVFIDASSYNPDVEISEPTLLVTPPNYVSKYSKTYTPHQNTLINPEMFGFSCLDDGIYMIEASVCPANLLFKRVGYLRTYNTRKVLKEQILRSKEEGKVNCNLIELWVSLQVAEDLATCEWDKAQIIFDYIKSQLNC